MKHSIRFLLAIVALLAGASASAQRVAVKTDLLDDALLNPNAGVEIKIASKWSFELLGQLNAWELDHGSKMWKHWMAMPELRYWFCDVWDGHFVGVHAFGGQYNIGGLKGMGSFLGTDFGKLADHRYQGPFVGAGIAYGYDWAISRHWNIEAELGLGWIYTRFDSYPCAKCGNKLASGRHHNYFGPTKAAVNLVYLF